MESTQKIPLTNAQRVARSKAKAVAAGGCRAPDGILSPEVSAALKALVTAKYADSAIGAVSTALLDAYKKIQRS